MGLGSELAEGALRLQGGLDGIRGDRKGGAETITQSLEDVTPERLDDDTERCGTQHRPEHDQRVTHRLFQVDLAPLVAGLVDRGLLEAAHEPVGALQIAQNDVAAFAGGTLERVELAALQRPRRDARAQFRRLLLQMRSGREADAERRIDLVRDARDEPTQRRQLFRLDELPLRLTQLIERRLSTM